MIIKRLLCLISICSATVAQNCRSSTDCDSGLSCITAKNGSKVCSTETTSSITIDATLTPMKYQYCRKDDDCEGIGSKCVMYSWYGVCELSTITTIKTKYGSKHRFRLHNKKGINEPCKRDDDCLPELMCVHRRRQSKCQISFRTPPSFECQSTTECPQNTICIYSKFYKKTICERKTSINRGIWVDKRLSEYLKNSELLDEKTGESENVEASSYFFETAKSNDAIRLPISGDVDVKKTVDRSNLQHTDPDSFSSTSVVAAADNEAVTKSVMQSSAANVQTYQMSTSTLSPETDSESSVTSTSNITINNHSFKTCISNEQICKKNETGLYVCQHLYSVSAERICMHDFECSGGWQCINVGTAEQKRFRCRPPLFKRWSDKQSGDCRNDLDCPLAQSCIYFNSGWRCTATAR
uniref:Dickkopf_N domain-containing protein n=1 Tax=Syphacia muris TaxID=451379 RepID=A0A0N5AVL0_9BILA